MDFLLEYLSRFVCITTQDNTKNLTNSSTIFLSLQHPAQEKTTLWVHPPLYQEFSQFFKSWLSSGFPKNFRNYPILTKEPIGVDHSIILITDKSKHMAFKHSDWLETHYCMKIQNLLFTLVLEEPL